MTLRDNPVFLGLFGSMIMGSIMYGLKAAPQKVSELLFRTFTVKLTITSGDEVFVWVNEWLSTHIYAKKARSLRVTTKPDDESQWTIAPGLGTHYFWDKGPIVVTRVMEEKQPADKKIRETITIWTLTRSQAKIRQLIAKSKEEKVKNSKDLIKFNTWTNWWGWSPVVINKKKRDLSTVFLPQEQKQQLVDDVQWFLDNEKWFRERGVPYRQGFLFYGPPGTGKTTIVASLASHFDRTVCLLTPNTLSNDEELLDAFRKLPKNSILLIEDVDCLSISKKRKSKSKKKSRVIDDEETDNEIKITLSGMLNAIDGVTTAEGHILMMTTNHIEKIDPALIRDGRVNKKVEIGLMSLNSVFQMAEKFFPDREDILKIIRKEANSKKLQPPAYWQRRMMDLHLEKQVTPEVVFPSVQIKEEKKSK